MERIGEIIQKEYNFVRVNGRTYYDIAGDKSDKRFCVVCGSGIDVRPYLEDARVYSVCRSHGQDDKSTVHRWLRDRMQYMEARSQTDLFNPLRDTSAPK